MKNDRPERRQKRGRHLIVRILIMLCSLLLLLLFFFLGKRTGDCCRRTSIRSSFLAWLDKSRTCDPRQWLLLNEPNIRPDCRKRKEREHIYIYIIVCIRDLVNLNYSYKEFNLITPFYCLNIWLSYWMVYSWCWVGSTYVPPSRNSITAPTSRTSVLTDPACVCAW